MFKPILLLVMSLFLNFTNCLNAQSPVWMLGQQGLVTTPTTASINTLSNIPSGFTFEPAGFNAAIDANNEVAFYVNNGVVYYPDGLPMGAIQVNFYSPNPIFGQPLILNKATLAGTPEISIVPVPGRCGQFYIIGCHPTYMSTQITNTGTDPAIYYATVNMAVIDPVTNRYGTFWNAATQQIIGAIDVNGTEIDPEGYDDWSNYNVHTSEMHIGVTALRSDGLRFLFIARGGHIYKSSLSPNGIGKANEIPYTSTSNAQSGNSVAELEIWEDFEDVNTNYKLAFPEGNSDRIVITTINHSGNYSSNTQSIVSGFNTSGSFSNPIRGLEFSPSGNYLYVSVTNGNYLRCFTTDNLSPVTFNSFNPGGLIDFSRSHIETGVNKKLYLMSENGVTLGEIVDPNNPSSTTFNVLNNLNTPYTTNNLTINAPEFLSQFYLTSGYILESVLPDQVDGENYSNNFGGIDRACCQYSTVYNELNYNIEYDQSWNGGSNPIVPGSSIITIKDDFIVRSGFTLNLSDITMAFGSGGRLIIEPGATLNAEGCTFTGNRDCNIMWQGIVVLGDKRTNPNQMGVLHMVDGNFGQARHCIVENALKGVSTGYLFDPNLSANYYDGGYIFIENARFFNNYVAVEYASLPIGGIPSLPSGIPSFPNGGLTSFITDCEFLSDNDMWYPYYRQRTNTFIHAIDVTGKEISFTGNNTFDNGVYGFNLQNCRKIGINQSDFSNCLVGIWSNTSGTTGAISENLIQANHFINTHTCIRIENGRDDEITANDFNQLNGDQDDNFYGIFLDNTSNFRITDNLFNYNKYGVYVINSGQIGGSITRNNFGNYFTGCYRGIHTYLDNSGLLISCNQFINNINFGINNPNQFSAAWFVNGDLADQGDPQFFGVNNEFLRINNRKDIASILDNSSNSCNSNFNFCYFSTQGLQNGDPTINSSYPFANPQFTITSVSDCDRQSLMLLSNNDPGLAQEMIANESNELQKRIWINELLRWYVVNEENDSLIAFLQNSTELSDREQLFFQYLANNNFSEASSVLSTIASINETDAQQFAALNTITLFVAQNNVSIKSIDSISLATITNIASTDTRISAQARSLLSQIVDSMQNISINTDTLFNRFANFEAEINSFSLSPNPASTQTTFKLTNVDYTNDLFLEIVDIGGRLLETISILNSNEQIINLANYESGVYLMKLRNRDAFIESQKIILNNR